MVVLSVSAISSGLPVEIAGGRLAGSALLFLVVRVVVAHRILVEPLAVSLDGVAHRFGVRREVEQRQVHVIARKIELVPDRRRVVETRRGGQVGGRRRRDRSRQRRRRDRGRRGRRRRGARPTPGAAPTAPTRPRPVPTRKSRRSAFFGMANSYARPRTAWQARRRNRAPASLRRCYPRAHGLRSHRPLALGRADLRVAVAGDGRLQRWSGHAERRDRSGKPRRAHRRRVCRPTRRGVSSCSKSSSWPTNASVRRSRASSTKITRRPLPRARSSFPCASAARVDRRSKSGGGWNACA